MPNLPCGLLNLNKPAGWTSRQAVDRVARLVKPAKAGHAGTLDPLATGVLVVCVGKATRLIGFIQELPKIYRASFLLGKRSDTDDITGEVQDVKVAEPPTRKRIEAALAGFVGRIEQVPPQFSAVHVDGRRAYQLARTGETAELSPRTVDVYGIELMDFDFPLLEVEIECGSGTYVRAIGRDLGEVLGCGAVMSKLERTAIGPFVLGEAIDPECLDAATLKEKLVPALTAVAHLPQYECSLDELANLRHGRSIPGATSGRSGEPTALIGPDGQLAVLAVSRDGGKTLQPTHVFC